MSEGATTPSAPEPFRLTPKLWILSASVMVAVFMHSLDATIANVALPHMQGSMNASLDQIAWVLTSYVMAAAIVTPLTAFLVNRFGRRRVFVLSLAGFTLASTLCGVALNLEQIVLFRVMQGATGACLMPISQAILLDSYPKEKHPTVISIWLTSGMLAPICGPMVGGYLTELYNWRSIFYINIPIGIVLTIGTLYSLTDSKHQTQLRFDLFGFAFLSIAIASFQMMLDRGTTLDWFSSKEIVIEAIIAAIAFYVFIVHALTTPNAYVNINLFKDLNYAVGVVLAFVVAMTVFSAAALYPTMLQSLMGYPVITASYLMMSRGFGMILATVIVGRIPRDLDPRIPVILGAGLIGYSMWEVSTFDLNASRSLIVWNNFVQGAGLGLILGLGGEFTLHPAVQNIEKQLRADS